MIYEPITSFRRKVEAVYLRQAPAPATGTRADKWQILRDLTTARLAYDLGDRALAVLQALLSFHQGAELSGPDLIVFPSNKALCERLNGMASSTMRRHLGALLDRGLIARRDSPNGKRFVRRYRAGSEAFGFDLAPLLARAPEIARAAEEALAAREALDRRRREVSLMRRDLAALCEFGDRSAPNAANWAELGDLARLAARDLRRRNDLDALDRIAADLDRALDITKAALSPETSNPGTNDTRTGQHHQRSEKDYIDSEETVSPPDAPAIIPEPADSIGEANNEDIASKKRPIPLSYVLSVCTEFRSLAPDPIENMQDFVRTAESIKPMLGISNGAWSEAEIALGPDGAAVSLAAMLQRIDKIRVPGAYLRHLARKAVAGRFSPISMLSALEKCHGSQL